MKYLLFLGSTRASAPPRPTRLGERLARAMMPILTEDDRETELIDPLEIDLPHPFKPHFAYAKDKAPDALGALAERISAADGYVMLIPTLIDQNPCAHWRRPMDMMRQGWLVSSFQASQQWSTMSS